MKNSNAYVCGRNFLRRATVLLIALYQKTLSPDHGAGGAIFGFSRCRFFPSCSEYTLAAVRQYGLFTGGVVSLRRIMRCHPWNKGGYDPVRIKTTD